MQVTWGGESVTVELPSADGCLRVAAASGGEPRALPAAEVTQLSRSRRQETGARVCTADGAAAVLAFASLADRERFIEAVVAAQQRRPGAAAARRGAAADWQTRAVCEAAVDEGLVEAAELEELLAAAQQRGVAQPLDALETLVDPETLRLRPITEQVENDVLRQVPLLAAIFARSVHSPETRRQFWEAAVRKHFCFARTFLDDDLAEAAATEEGTPAAPAPASEPAAINQISWAAMPKRAPGSGVAAAPDDDQSDPYGAAAYEGALEGGAAPRHPLLPAFTAARPRHSLRAAPPASAAGPPPPALFTRGGPRPHRGLGVCRRLPAGRSSRETLEQLRAYWRADRRARPTAWRKLCGTGDAARRSFLERCCVEQAGRMAGRRQQQQQGTQ